MPIIFRYNQKVYLGIYQNAEPTCLTRLSRNQFNSARSRQMISQLCLRISQLIKKRYAARYHSSVPSLKRFHAQLPVDHFESFLPYPCHSDFCRCRSWSVALCRIVTFDIFLIEKRKESDAI
ncbi:hypothetical protein TNCV_3762831 [Trichonephila clavipes]|nr:hypothetical protein TNCV_3762831 [Trichonephila clavipes]